MEPLEKEALAIAASQVGVWEEGHNSGERVGEYLASVGLSKGNPWCAAFVYWCAQQAAKRLLLRNPLPRSGACERILSWAKRAARLVEQPRPGNLFLLISDTGLAHHTGFVVAVHGTHLGTIEGNTNLDGSREGIGVFHRLREMSENLRFVRW